MPSRLMHPTPQLQTQNLFQALPDLAYRLAADGTILELNTGETALVGQRLQDTRLAEVCGSFSQALAQIAAERSILTLEYARQGDKGETHHEARLVPLPAGEILVLVRDVTERRLAENALRESHAKFRLLADNVTDVFWIRTADMREVLYMSPGFERIWGRPMSIQYGSPAKWVDYIVPEDRPRVLEVFDALTAHRRSVDIEYRITRPDGDIRWIRARAFPVRDAQGTVIRNTGIASDITERKRAEEAAQRSQKRLRDLIDGLGPSMFVGLMTLQGILIEANRPALAAAGLKPEDVLGKPLEETYWWAYSQEVQQQLRQAIARAVCGESSRYDVQLRAAENQFIDVDFSLQPLRDETGEVVFLVPSANVITERKQAEALLNGQKRVLEMIAASAPLGESLTALVRLIEAHAPGMLGSILLLDADGVHLRDGASPSLPPEYVAAIDGISIGPSAGSCGTAAYSKEAVMVEDIATDPRWADYKAVALPHGLRACWSTPIFDAQRRVFGTFAMYYRQSTLPQPDHQRLIDIAVHAAAIAIGRYRTETALRESEERLRLAVQASNVGLWDWDLRTNQVIYSHESKSQLGYEETEIRNEFSEFERLVHPDDLAAMLESIRRYQTQPEGAYEAEYRMRHKDGTWRWIYARGELVRDASGAAVRMLGCRLDLTEHHRAEQEIRDLNASLERRVAERTQQLEEANRAKSDFLANMSHELRTPLNSIIGFSEMLKDGVLGELDKKQRGFTVDIFDAGTHLLSLINDILDLSKVEAGMLQLEADAVDVAALLKASTLVVREKAHTHRIRLDTQLDPALGTLLADERKVKQIVYNLLSNAVKFTPDGGVVTLRARRCTRAEVALDPELPGRLIALPLGEDNEFLAITVDDSGIGIAEQDLAKLFEPFMQVGSSVARHHGGTGLGLSLVRRLAELHGGTVGVASRPGVGSAFSVWLPYRAAAPATRISTTRT